MAITDKKTALINFLDLWNYLLTLNLDMKTRMEVRDMMEDLRKLLEDNEPV